MSAWWIRLRLTVASWLLPSGLEAFCLTDVAEVQGVLHHLLRSGGVGPKARKVLRRYVIEHPVFFPVTEREIGENDASQKVSA